jgi:hypothetical protein
MTVRAAHLALSDGMVGRILGFGLDIHVTAVAAIRF